MDVQVLLVVALLVATTLGCMLPQPVPQPVPMAQALVQAPMVLYGKVLDAHKPGEPVQPIKFQVYCHYKIHYDMPNSEILIVGDFVGNSCSNTKVMEGGEYILAVKHSDRHHGQFDITEANPVTPAAWEPTMENLSIMADSLCVEGFLMMDAPAYITQCPAPSRGGDCYGDAEEVTKQQPGAGGGDQAEVIYTTSQPDVSVTGDDKAAAVLGGASRGGVHYGLLALIIAVVIVVLWT